MSAHEIEVKGLAPSTTEQQVKDFFSFCGKVSSVKLNSAQGTASVNFEKAAAISTAILLNDSEFNGSKVTVSASASPESVQSAVANEKSESPIEGQVSQEDKPKSTILAEYLSHGYVLGDKAVASGIELDKKHGISDRFAGFLKSLDTKYHDTKKDLDSKYDLHNKKEALKERADAADKQYGISDTISHGQATINKYLDHALSTDTGSRLRSFYTNIAQQVSDVHNEARRLADLKENKEPPASTVEGLQHAEAAGHTTVPSSGEKPAQ